MGCIVLCTAFHTAPEQEQGPEPAQGRMVYIHFSGPKTVSGGVFQYLNGSQVSSAGPDTASVKVSS